MSLPRQMLSAVRRGLAGALAVATALAVAGVVPAAHAADAPGTVEAAQAARATLSADPDRDGIADSPAHERNGPATGTRMLTLHITVWGVGPTTREPVDQ